MTAAKFVFSSTYSLAGSDSSSRYLCFCILWKATGFPNNPTPHPTPAMQLTYTSTTMLGVQMKVQFW